MTLDFRTSVLSDCSKSQGVLKELPQNLELPFTFSFPEVGLPFSLMGLEIRSSEFLVEMIIRKLHKSKTTLLLEHLVTEGCSSVKSLSRDLPSGTLEGLEILSCSPFQSV